MFLLENSMKKIRAGICCFFLMLFSISSYAERIIITGQPLPLEERGSVYYLPETYQPGPYHYVTLGNTTSVCFSESQPDLTSLMSQNVIVEIGGRQVQWVCYNYDDTYFSVTP
jgi:hypothetical protein